MSAKRETPADKAARLAARRAPAVETVNEGPSPAEVAEKPPVAARSANTTSTRDVRVSLDLKPALYDALTDWNRGAARMLDRGRVTNAQTLRALVRRLLDDPELTGQIMNDLRLDK